MTAEPAAAGGAKVMLVARNEDSLRDAVERIAAEVDIAIYAMVDVGEIEQARAAVCTGIVRFGRIDTWINNAGPRSTTSSSGPSR